MDDADRDDQQQDDQGQDDAENTGDDTAADDSGRDDDSEPPADTPDDESVILRNELNRAKRKLAEHDRQKRKEERERAQAEGRHEEVLKSYEQERDEALAAKEEAELELSGFKNRIKVEGIAKRLKFHDPDDAARYLSDEEQAGSEAAVEAALRTVIRNKPHLVDKGSARSGGSMGDDTSGGDGKKPIRTMEDVAALSREEHIERREEVDKVLAEAARA